MNQKFCKFTKKHLIRFSKTEALKKYYLSSTEIARYLLTMVMVWSMPLTGIENYGRNIKK